MRTHTACLLMVVASVCSAATETDGGVTFQTEHFRLEISSEGVMTGLVDLRDGKNYAAEDGVPFATLARFGRRHAAVAVTRSGDRLQIGFADTDVTATVAVRETRGWLTFEIVGMSDEAHVEELECPCVKVAMPRDRTLGVQACVVRTDRFAIGCQALNLQTDSHAQPVPVTKADADRGQRPVLLLARAFQRFGLVGARAALFAAPTERVLDVIEQLELAEHLPHPTLDGVWARRSPDARRSYLFIDMTEQNADEVIRIAKELNFGYILIYAHRWATTRGSYEINRTYYPHGPAGLKAVADKAHAAGLKVGIHCLTGFVSKSDPLVHPKPHPGLAKDGRVTLAAEIGLDDTVISTVEPPADFPDDIAFGGQPQGFDVQIGDEIITYDELSKSAPYGLKGCRRGAHGTVRAAHHPGETVWHLTQRYAHYLVDPDGDLVDRVARRYADVINQCGIDMIYFDGAGANVAFGKEWAWRYVPLIPLRSAALWQREVRVGGSCSGPLFWHLKSFRTCNDFVEIAVKTFFDQDKLPIARMGEANWIPVDLGWWGLHSWAPHRCATVPDEIDYICQKALAYDACWSFETTLETIQACGRWDDIKRIIATYERLRLANTFSDDVKRALREPGAECKLVGSDAGGWRPVPVQYSPPHWVLDKPSSTWTLPCRRGPQPLQFRLYALPMLSPYAADENPVLVDQRDASVYSRQFAAARCRSEIKATTERTPENEPCIAFSASSQLRDGAGWVAHRVDLQRPGTLTDRPGLIEGLPEEISQGKQWARPLGVWVHGDGKSEVLNIQLQSSNGGYRDHYIDVDFTGWKYVELTQPETDRVFDVKAGYLQKHAVRHFQYDRLKSVYVRYNSIPAQTEVMCRIGPIKALREHWRPVAQPTFTINGQSIVFPCELATEQYLEFDGHGPARLYDREGRLIKTVEPEGVVPSLRPGKNTIRFSCQADASHSQRSKIVMIVLPVQAILSK